jgi:hypothetical protein
VAVGAFCVAVLAAVPAFGTWLTDGSANATALAGSVAAPASVSVAATTSTSVTIKVDAGPVGAAPSSYRVDRTSSTAPGAASGVCSVSSVGGTCTDSSAGMTANTTYTYAVYSALGSWVSSSGTGATAQTTLGRPRPSNVVLANGPANPGGLGTIQGEDSVAITFDSAMNASTICPNFLTTNPFFSQNQGAVKISPSDVMTFPNSGCSIGAVDLRADYNPGTTDLSYGGRLANVTRFEWNATSRTLTVTLKGFYNVMPAMAASVPIYTPNAAITGADGTGIDTTPFTAPSASSF